MKQENQLEKFIELRIEGKSFDAISQELKIAKQTLIEWNKQLRTRNAIEEGKTLKLNTIIKAYGFDLQNRLSNYMELSKRIKDELLSRDISEISTETLLKMSIANDDRIKTLIDKNFEFGINPSHYKLGADESGYFSIKLDE